jgi:hypothetical protein
MILTFSALRRPSGDLSTTNSTRSPTFGTSLPATSLIFMEKNILVAAIGDNKAPPAAEIEPTNGTKLWCSSDRHQAGCVSPVLRSVSLAAWMVTCLTISAFNNAAASVAAACFASVPAASEFA